MESRQLDYDFYDGLLSEFADDFSFHSQKKIRVDEGKGDVGERSGMSEAPPCTSSHINFPTNMDMAHDDLLPATASITHTIDQTYDRNRSIFLDSLLDSVLARHDSKLRQEDEITWDLALADTGMSTIDPSQPHASTDCFSQPALDTEDISERQRESNAMSSSSLHGHNEGIVMESQRVIGSINPAITAMALQRPTDLSQRLATAIRSRELSIRTSVQNSWRLPSALVLNPRLLSGVSHGQLDGIGCFKFVMNSVTKLPRHVPRQSAMASTSEAAIRSHLLQFAQGVVTHDKDLSGSVGSILQKWVTPFGSVMQRVGFYIMEGLQARMNGVTAQDYIKPLLVNREVVRHVEKLGSRVPLLTLTMDAINDVIVDCVGQSDVIHIVDLTGWSGQWGPLFRSLAGRPSGPPTVRMTVVAAPPDTPWGTGPTLPPRLLKMEVMKAAAEAGVDCWFTSVVSRLEDLSSEKLGLLEGEMLAVSGCMRLQQLPDQSVLRSNPRNAFLQKVRSWNPRIVALAGFQVDQNMPFFLKRVDESINFYCTIFEVFEAMVGHDSITRHAMEKTMMRREIIHVLSCEGLERIQREEKIEKWQKRMRETGFRPQTLNPKSVETITRRAKSHNPNFNSALCQNALLLTWKGIPLVGIHAWT